MSEMTLAIVIGNVLFRFFADISPSKRPVPISSLGRDSFKKFKADIVPTMKGGSTGKRRVTLSPRGLYSAPYVLERKTSASAARF